MAPAFLAHLASYRDLFMLRIQVHRAKDLFSSGCTRVAPAE